MDKSCLNCKHWIADQCCNKASAYYEYDNTEMTIEGACDWWEEKNTEKVNHPSHYQGAHECIDVMIAVFGEHSVMEFCRCNIFKYRFRAGAKNGEEDIKKAEWYEAKLMELQDKRNNKPNSF